MDLWKYGQLDKANEPVLFSSTIGDTIKQNAGRMCCLMHHFTLMVAHNIAVGDEYPRE